MMSADELQVLARLMAKKPDELSVVEVGGHLGMVIRYGRGDERIAGAIGTIINKSGKAQPIATLFIPGDAPSTPNLREHWATKARRNKATRRKTLVIGGKLKGSIPALVRIELVRIGARALDGDNLQGALKGHRDAVASLLRIDDASPLARWEYAQETTSDARTHGVRVTVGRL
jgi:hypothetical protein